MRVGERTNPTNPKPTPFVLAASVAVLGLVLAAGPSASEAHAEERPLDKKTCIAAAERGQELRDGKHMRDARGQFALCSRSECPKSVATECTRWRAEAEAALGSVKLEAVDPQNKPVVAVKVVVDGSPWTDDLSAPIVLDPGSHEIRFEREGSPAVVRTVTLAMGDRDQVVRAVFEGAPAASKKNEPTSASASPKDVSKPPSGGSGGSLVAPILLGSVGVVSLGVAGAFWLMGNADLDDARARCNTTGGCVDADADGAKTKHLIGDIALGVGVVAIVAAAYFLITRESPSPTVATRTVVVRF